MKDNFFEEITTKLRERGIEEGKINYIRSLVKESSRDSNLLILYDDVFDNLANKGLDKIFEEVCKELNISWNYSNDPLI